MQQELRDETREEEETDERAERGVSSRLGSLKLPALCGSGVAGATGVISAVSHFGMVGGLTITAVAAIVAWRHGPDLIEEYWHPAVIEAEPVVSIPAPVPEVTQQPNVKRTVMQRVMGQFPDAPEAVAVTTRLEPEPQPERDDLSQPATLNTEPEFLAVGMPESETMPAIPRITIEQIVQHTTRNSYTVYIGRSLTRQGAPAVAINFYKRHLKCVGATQHGKSSEAALLIDAITRTHDPQHVLLAMLDMEDKTGRLFADLPHLLRVQVNGQVKTIHAHNAEQVLEYLEYLVQLVDWRYTLPEDELDQMPIILVYLEEFIELKESFKQRIAMATEREARQQAMAEYERLVYCIKHLVRWGLKALVQVLLCAQVDYRDEDLQEALVNVTSGMAFTLRPTAAQAAGFQRQDLIKRNFYHDQVGEFVAEMPDVKDLVLAPEYPLRQYLAQLHSRQRQPNNVVTLRPSGRSQDSGRTESAPTYEREASGVRTSPQVPQMGSDAPGERQDSSPERDFVPGPDDGLIPDDKQDDLAYFYRKHGDVKRALRLIGVGNQCYRHAAWLLEQRGLKSASRRA